MYSYYQVMNVSSLILYVGSLEQCKSFVAQYHAISGLRIEGRN